MTVEGAFKLYMATRLHFLGAFDVFETNGKFSWMNKVVDRKDLNLVSYYMKEADTERKIIELTAANMLYGYKDFLYNDPDEGLKNFAHWNMVKSSLSHILDRDLSYIGSMIDSGKCKSLRDFFQKNFISSVLSMKIEYETIILINRRFPVIDMIGGFDGGKYKVRLEKADKFVAKGTLASKHSAVIDDFLENLVLRHLLTLPKISIPAATLNDKKILASGL